jgi:hypothetical protein
MIEFLYFAAKALIIIFGMKYLSNVLIALFTGEKIKSKIFNTSHFKDED